MLSQLSYTPHSPLDDGKLFSIRRVSKTIAEKLKDLNNHPFKQIADMRCNAYLEEEKPYVLPLPPVPFEAAACSIAKVPNYYLVFDGRSRCSVPYNLIGKKEWI